MITISKRQLVYIGLVVAAVYLWNGGRLPSPSPVPDRPILRAIAKIAKSFLWVAVFAEGPPAEPPVEHMVRVHVGDDGYQILEHGRGW
jgi:hypothetical protein